MCGLENRGVCVCVCAPVCVCVCVCVCVRVHVCACASVSLPALTMCIFRCGLSSSQGGRFTVQKQDRREGGRGRRGKVGENIKSIVNVDRKSGG